MDKREFILAALSPADGDIHTPVQVQKLLFLIVTNIPGMVGGKHFKFKAYHYGPFAKEVYDELKELSAAGLVDIDGSQGWNSYRLTKKGQKKGSKLFDDLDDEAREYITEASQFVRSLSFTDLVAAIYKAYPKMRKNSVFVSS